MMEFFHLMWLVDWYDDGGFKKLGAQFDDLVLDAECKVCEAGIGGVNWFTSSFWGKFTINMAMTIACPLKITQLTGLKDTICHNLLMNQWRQSVYPALTEQVLSK